MEIILRVDLEFLQMLRVARKIEKCKVLGPGNRAVIWFHGCSRNCDGCIAKTMNLSNDYDNISADDLYKWISSCKDIEGVSISGGEPLEQNLEDLVLFLSLVKSDSRNLSIILFSGFTYDEIIKSSKKSLLPFIDILIDGIYKKELNDNIGLRGSSNQVIYFLTERYKPIKESFFKYDCRNIEVGITLNNTVTINGIPKVGFIENLKHSLKKEGFNLL